MEIDHKYFTRELYQKLTNKARVRKSDRSNRSDANKFDTYSFFTKNRRKLKSADDLIVAISIAYSWMPTMLDIYDQTDRSFKSLKKEIKTFSRIKSSDILVEKEKEIKDVLVKLSRATNNSIVGASKVLHMFYPEHIPIFDSRVMAAWNTLMKPGARIPGINKNNQVNSFFNYWLGILYWREALHHKGVRRIEKKLFDYGGRLKKLQKKIKMALNY